MPDRYPNKEPSSATGFGYSSGDPSGSLSDKTTKHPSPVTIINPASVPSGNSTTHPSPVPKELKKCQYKKHVHELSKWISNRCSQHHANCQDKFKYISICSQLRDPRGTIKSANIYKTFYPLYHLFFILNANIQKDVPTIDSYNIPHKGT